MVQLKVSKEEQENLVVYLETQLGQILVEMIDDGEAARGDRALIDRALRDGAEKLISELPELISKFPDHFGASARGSASDRRFKWRTEMQSAITSFGGQISFGVMVDELAKRGMERADKELSFYQAALTLMTERVATLTVMMRDLNKNNEWFSEGADWSNPHEGSESTPAQLWGQLLRLDPTERLQTLASIQDRLKAAWSMQMMDTRLGVKNENTRWHEFRPGKWMLMSPMGPRKFLEELGPWLAKAYPQIRASRSYRKEGKTTTHTITLTYNEDEE